MVEVFDWSLVDQDSPLRLHVVLVWACRERKNGVLGAHRRGEHIRIFEKTDFIKFQRRTDVFSMFSEMFGVCLKLFVLCEQIHLAHTVLSNPATYSDIHAPRSVSR